MPKTTDHEHDAGGCIECRCTAEPWNSKAECTCPEVVEPDYREAFLKINKAYSDAQIEWALERAAMCALRAEVEAVVRHWERTPALRRGSAAAEMRRALHRADATTYSDTQHGQEGSER